MMKQKKKLTREKLFQQMAQGASVARGSNTNAEPSAPALRKEAWLEDIEWRKRLGGKRENTRCKSCHTFFLGSPFKQHCSSCVTEWKREKRKSNLQGRKEAMEAVRSVAQRKKEMGIKW